MAQQQKLGKGNTNVRAQDGKTIVRFHDTDIVAWDANTITLDSGGWLTATTKTRMNQASNQFELGFRVFQQNHEWFVSRQANRIIPFSDGMILDRKG